MRMPLLFCAKFDEKHDVAMVDPAWSARPSLPVGYMRPTVYVVRDESRTPFEAAQRYTCNGNDTLAVYGRPMADITLWHTFSQARRRTCFMVGPR